MILGRNKNPEVPSQPRPLVLVIDDEPDICMMLEMALRSAGYGVEVACDGEAGLAMIESAKPDLIVLDIMMPRVNGYELLTRIQRDPEVPPAPVIVATSLTAEEKRPDEQWAERLGVCRFMTKPFSPEALVQAVRETLELD